MLFKSITTALIYSLCLFISTSSSAYCITSPFLVPLVLKTSNDWFIGSVLIFSSLTSFLSILVYMHLKSTNSYSHNSFLFCILIFACMFSSFFLLFLWFGIIYWFWVLDTEVLYTVSIQDLLQNPPICHLSCHLSLLEYCDSSSSTLIYSLWQYILLCHIYSIF